MKTVVLKFTILILLFPAISSSGQNSKKIRRTVAAGNFYPTSSNELRNQLDKLFNSVADQTIEDNINAIIVPDTKFEDSGEITAAAYSKINPEKDFTRVFIIGTSHNKKYNGVSVYKKGDYRTPLGVVRVDNEVVDRLILNNLIKYRTSAHKNEYSVEVQLPFLQHKLNKPFKIVPIIVGTQSTEDCKELAEILKPYFTPDNLFVISSDISQAEDHKNTLAEAITGISPDQLTELLLSDKSDFEPAQRVRSVHLSSTYSILNLILNNKNIQVESIKDTNVDQNQAKHFSFIIKNNIEEEPAIINLTQEDMQFLLRLVRETIIQKLEDNTVPEIDENELSENLKSKYGAFVTLTINDEIRGYMGKFTTTDPLYKVVQEMTVAAAFRDYRYSPISKKEARDIEIEISVVTPLKQVFSSDEIQLGKHGIHMTKNGRSGTFLPQVARTTGWSKNEFLGFCAQNKVGIGWKGWKTADLFTFEAYVFNRRDALRQQ